MGGYSLLSTRPAIRQAGRNTLCEGARNISAITARRNNQSIKKRFRPVNNTRIIRGDDAVNVFKHPQSVEVPLSGEPWRDSHNPELGFHRLALWDVQDREHQPLLFRNFGQCTLHSQSTICRHEGFARCSSILIPRRAAVVPFSTAARLDSRAIHRPSAIKPEQFVSFLE